MMTDTQAERFVAALDKVDIALLAIRREFEDLARTSAQKLADLREQEGKRVPGSRVECSPGHPLPSVSHTLGNTFISAPS